jgi:uncharacterized protein with ATP-grasp and redox domains
MIRNMYPGLPIPDPLRASELGSFAHDTVIRRLPEIVQRTLAENDFPSSVVWELQRLKAEIPDRPIRYLNDPQAPDAKEWQGYVQPYLGSHWLEIPWFFAEFYLYRRILEATGYFRSEAKGHLNDPYVMQKQMGLESTKLGIQHLAASTNRRIAEGSATSEILYHVLGMALWGNRADMSLWPVNGGDQAQINPNQSWTNKGKIIIDHSRLVVEYFCSLKTREARIDLLLDNAGFELVADLCMTDFLLSSGLATSVVLHPKAYPVFVSDAVIKDVEEALLFMEHQSSPEIDLVTRRLQAWLQEGRLRYQADNFWTSPLALWEMPESLRSDLGESDLVISKGDAHYRRLLGDRHWPPTTHFADILSYFPSPLLALRVGKSEVVCGLEPGQLKALDGKDPDWMTNGKWGWIQFKG